MVDVDKRWTLKASSSSWKTTFQTNGEGKAEMYLNYTAGRQPSIKLTADTLLYATPKALELKFTPQDDLIERITIGMRANHENQNHMAAFTEFVPNEQNTIHIDIDDFFEVQNDFIIYPVTLEFITFALNTKAEKKEYRIPFDGIYLIYDEQDTAIDNTPAQNSHDNARKVLLNGQLLIIKNGHIYNLLGNEIAY